MNKCTLSSYSDRNTNNKLDLELQMQNKSYPKKLFQGNFLNTADNMINLLNQNKTVPHYPALYNIGNKSLLISLIENVDVGVDGREETLMDFLQLN